ncbi:MAG: DUF4245 domain-containing protein [Nocardioidaceae bacterium]
MSERPPETSTQQPAGASAANPPPAPTSAAPLSQPRGRPTRTAMDMVRSMAVVLGFIGAIWLLSLVSRHAVTDPVQRIDYSSQLAVARDTAPYRVLAPRSLPSGWEATSVDAEGDSTQFTWHLGFLIDRADYVGLEQSNTDSALYISQTIGADTPDGRQDIGGVSWRRLIDQNSGDHSLVRVTQAATTIVTGTLSYASLADFIATLR